MEMPKIVATGIYNSRVARPNITESKNRKTTMFEIELPIEKGGISYINSASMPIDTNMIICAKPGQTRHTKFPFKCYYIHMVVHTGILYDMMMELPDFFATNKRGEYEEIFTDMIRHYDTLSQKEEIMIQSLLLKLIYTLNKDISTQYVRKKTETDNIINKTLNYIDNHIEEDLSLEAIAKYNKLSAIHFHNTFKYATGKTLRDYVEQQRIKKAINLLLTTNLNLTGIAFECGFSSQSYFSYVFKRRMKCTPREYVIKINNKYENIET